MNKYLLSFLSIVLILTGCSLFDRSEEVVQEISDIVDERNALHDQTEHQNQQTQLNNAIQAFEQSYRQGNSDEKLYEELNTQLNLGKTLAEEKQKGTQATIEKAKSLKENLGRLSDERETMVIDTLDAFIKMTENEQKFYELEVQIMDLDIAFYQTLYEGGDPKQDSNQELRQQYSQLNQQINDELKKFNAAWNNLHLVVRGENTRREP